MILHRFWLGHNFELILGRTMLEIYSMYIIIWWWHMFCVTLESIFNHKILVVLVFYHSRHNTSIVHLLNHLINHLILILFLFLNRPRHSVFYRFSRISTAVIVLARMLVQSFMNFKSWDKPEALGLNLYPDYVPVGYSTLSKIKIYIC